MNFKVFFLIAIFLVELGTIVLATELRLEEEYCGLSGCTISGNLSVNGDIFIQDSILSVRDQELNASFLPTLNNKFDIGSAAKRWKDAYFSGTLTADSITGGVWNVTGTNIFPSDLTASVGIGTVSPAEALHVKGDFEITDEDSTDRIFRILDSADDGVLELYANNVNTIYLHGGTGDSYFNAGDIGIGTTDPQALLHVKHSDSGQTPTNINGLFVENTGSINTYYVFQTATTGGGKSFSITNAGNVGIGTTSPDTLLHLNASTGDAVLTIDADNDPFINFERRDALKFSMGYDVTDANFHISKTDINSGPDGTFAIEGNGNVGIGTTSPGYKLDIQDSSDVGINIESTEYNDVFVRFRVNASVRGYLGYDDNDGILKFVSGGALSSSSQGIVLDSSGNIGIGTTSPEKILHINDADALIRFDRAGNYRWHIGIGDGNPIPTSYFGIEDFDGGIVPFVIALTTGNIGIGNTSPNHKLSVQGDIYTNGTVFASGMNITDSFFSLTDNENASLKFTLTNENSGENASTVISAKNDMGSSMSIGIASSMFELGGKSLGNITALLSKSMGDTYFANFYNRPFRWLLNPQDDNDANNLVEVMRLDKNGLNVSGNLTANFIYAEMWGKTVGEVTLTDAGQYVNFTVFNDTKLNGFTYSAGELTAEIGGMYLINSQFAFSGSANQEYHLAFGVNGVRVSNCHTARVIGTGGDVGSASITCLCPMNTGDVSTAMIENIDSSSNPTIYDININLVRIGD